MKRKHFLIFLLCYAAYTAIYIARLNLSMAAPGIKDSDILDAAQIGFLGSIFSIIYACGRFLNGALSDKTPPWIMIASGLLISGISNTVIGIFPPFWAMVLLWGANAYAQSMLWSSLLLVVSTIYDADTAREKTAFLVTSVSAGNILGIILNTVIINKLGLAFAFSLPGGLTLLFSLLVILSLRSVNTKPSRQKKHIPILELFKNREIKLALIPSMLHGVMKDNISLWMAAYFVDRFVIDLNKSAGFVLFIPLMGFVGRLIYPFFYKITHGREHLVSLIGFSACVPAAIPLALGGITPIVSAICLSVIYASVSVINTSMLSIFPIRFLSTGNVASVSGIMDLATYAGAGISSFAYGILIEHMGYAPMYVSWAVISVISIFIMLRLLKTSVIK